MIEFKQRQIYSAKSDSQLQTRIAKHENSSLSEWSVDLTHGGRIMYLGSLELWARFLRTDAYAYIWFQECDCDLGWNSSMLSKGPLRLGFGYCVCEVIWNITTVILGHFILIVVFLWSLEWNWACKNYRNHLTVMEKLYLILFDVLAIHSIIAFSERKRMDTVHKSYLGSTHFSSGYLEKRLKKFYLWSLKILKDHT